MPDPKRLGVRVIHRLREWNIYEAIAEQGVTERSISLLVVNAEIDDWVRQVIKWCLQSTGGASVYPPGMINRKHSSVALTSSNGNTVYCNGGGFPMVDEQETLPESGFFLRRTSQNDTTRLVTKQGILEAVAPQRLTDEMRYLLNGIHAVCDQICGNLSITPDFSALQGFGDFSYRRNVSLQLVPGAYSSRRGGIDEEEAANLLRNWRWVSVPDNYLRVDREGSRLNESDILRMTIDIRVLTGSIGIGSSNFEVN